MNGNGKSWTEWLRLITPIGIFILGVFVTDINKKIDCIDQKLFIHLTNDEMHSPRSLVVTKPEFTMYQVMRDKQMEDIREKISDIKDFIVKVTTKK